MTIGQMIGIECEDGAIAGTCYLCSEETPAGFAESPSEAFTAWASTFRGDVLCPACRAMLHDRRFRGHTWLATPGVVRFERAADRHWMWGQLMEPPDPPFAIYITAAGQKQGWIPLLRYPAESRDTFFIGCEWADRPVLFARGWALGIAPLLDTLRDRKVSRIGLTSGAFSNGAWKTALEGGWTELLEQAGQLAGDPRWEAMVRVHP